MSRVATRSLRGFALTQLRERPGRAAAIGAGVLVAALSFGLLSSETATSNLAVTKTVKDNFRAAYDILVRPKNAQTPFEEHNHVVDSGFLSGLFGGITLKQYDQIKSLSGVALAAPVANVGYFLLTDRVFVPFPKSVRPTSTPQIYEVTTSWDVHHGLSDYPGATFYLYWTPQTLTFSNSDTEDGTETIAGERLHVCEGFARSAPPTNVVYRQVDGKRVPVLEIGKVPHPYALQPLLDCASPKVVVTGAALHALSAGKGPRSFVIRTAEDSEQVGAEPSGQLGAIVKVEIPVLVAGIDPTAEAALVGLKGAMQSGNYLRDGEGLSAPTTFSETAPGAPKLRTYPVIASTDTYLDEDARLTIHRLRLPSGVNVAKELASQNAYTFVTHLSGRVVGHSSLSPNTAWDEALANFSTKFTVSYLSPGYWRPSSTSDQVIDGKIMPRTVKNNPSVWANNSSSPATIGISLAPPGSNDTWYRSLTAFGQSGADRKVDGQMVRLAPFPRLVGTFNPAKLRGFSPLSRVPLQTFYPPTVTAGDPAAKAVLGTSPLGPTTNLGGYLSQPPLLLTTLKGAIALDNGERLSYSEVEPNGNGTTRKFHIEAYQGASPKAPISTIQVRVKGVTGPNALSLARIKVVAEEIEAATHLTVNITAGSSPTPELIQLSAGKFGQPPLLVKQGWVKEDVDSAIIQALSGEDLALSLLAIGICGLAVAAATAASVRQRRREIAVLSVLGWSGRSTFALVVGEAAVVGLLAGALGGAVSVGLALAGSLHIPVLRLVLVIPVAVALAVLAAALPARLAARVPPLDALRPPVTAGQAHKRVRGTTSLAFANLLRVPGRSGLSLVTLAAGVGALAFVVGLGLAFRGAVAGTLLGNVVALRVRGVDVVSAVLVVVVGAGAAADVLVVSLRERSAELATLRALGWAEQGVAWVAATEGLMIGIAGSLLGAVLGAVTVALLGGHMGPVALTAALAFLGGVVVTTAAMVLPVARLSQHALASALAGAE